MANWGNRRDSQGFSTSCVSTPIHRLIILSIRFIVLPLPLQLHPNFLPEICSFPHHRFPFLVHQRIEERLHVNLLFWRFIEGIRHCRLPTHLLFNDIWLIFLQPTWCIRPFPFSFRGASSSANFLIRQRQLDRWVVFFQNRVHIFRTYLYLSSIYL